MADTLREQILAILEAETDADPEPVDDAEAPAEESTEPVPDNQFDDAAIQAMIQSAVAEALAAERPATPPTQTILSASTTPNRPPARTGRLTNPDFAKMSPKERQEAYHRTGGIKERLIEGREQVTR